MKIQEETTQPTKKILNLCSLNKKKYPHIRCADDRKTRQQNLTPTIKKKIFLMTLQFPVIV